SIIIPLTVFQNKKGMRHVMCLISWRLSSIDFVIHSRRLNNGYCDAAHAKTDMEQFIFNCMIRIR
ncbi:hypothetical protein, partial [Enterobacter hormaechei]|uniref:hypothetical protein n=1 Tax=Enterobacter hormaechei TaxID=158836 RepID=UPI001C3E8825